MTLDILKDRIRIILVEPRHPGNIGSVARAMKNMGVLNLALVNPCDFLCEEALKLAHGSIDILESAEVFSRLPEALHGIQTVIGASAKKGRGRKTPIHPDQLASSLGIYPAFPKTAVVFGREDGGLTNEELLLCRQVIQIPAAVSYPSINLSHAVMIVLYDLYDGLTGQSGINKISELKPPQADALEIEMLYQRMKEAFRAIGFDRKGSDKRILRSVRRILEQRSLETRDIRTGHKILDYFFRTNRS
jgi:TrmH family RNA methyltransferase